MLLSHKCRVVNGVIKDTGKEVYVVSVNQPKLGDKISNYFEYRTKDEADLVVNRYRESLVNVYHEDNVESLYR